MTERNSQHKNQWVGLIDAGLTVRRVVEPTPTPLSLARRPDMDRHEPAGRLDGGRAAEPGRPLVSRPAGFRALRYR
jgi:hypothetical protein